MKFLGAALWTIFCIILALIVPSIFYGIYHMVSPVSEVGKILLICVMLLTGTGLTVFAGFGSFALWLSGLSKIIE